MADELDAQRVLDAVTAERAPAEWKVYHARRTYFYGEAFISFFIAAILALFSGGVIWVLIAIKTEPSSPDGEGAVSGPDAGEIALFSAIALGCAIGAAVLIWLSVRQIRSSRSADTQLLVLMSAGFVVRTPTTELAVRYGDVLTISMRVTHSKYDTFIHLYMIFRHARDGGGLGYLDWQVDPRFGDKDEIAQAIIEGHARFQASR